MSLYAKFLAAVTAALAVLGSAVADGVVTATEGVAIASATVGALAVYVVPNTPKGDR